MEEPQVRSSSLEGGVELIELSGELDTLSAGELRSRIASVIESGRHRLLVDASEATFLDSASIGALVGGATRLKPVGGALALVCANADILASLQIAALDQVMVIRSSRDEALEELRRLAATPHEDGAHVP